MGVAEIELLGVHMIMLPEAAIYIPSRKELLIADLHLGKAEHFRKNGIGIPGEVTLADIDILYALVATYMPVRVVFLGDLFHSKHNSAWGAFKEIITEFAEIEFYLVVGNHDILEADHYSGLHLCSSYDIGDILCTHEPLSVPINGRYNLCGHIHPAAKLRGKGKQYLRLPCFYFSEEVGIMPAFGSFTGMHNIKPKRNDKVYVIGGGAVKRVH